MLDDLASENLNALGDRLAISIETLERAIGVINVASYSEPRWDDRARARRLLGQVLVAVAQVSAELSKPIPAFRPNLTGPRPTVRHRRVEEDVAVADFQPVAVPAWARVGAP